MTRKSLVIILFMVYKVIKKSFVNVKAIIWKFNRKFANNVLKDRTNYQYNVFA